MLAAFLWSPTPEILYRQIAGAKQVCSEFRFQLTTIVDGKCVPYKIGSDGEAGFIKFDKAGRITVAVGYVWDGASGPTIDTPDSVCASLGHDVLYELMRLGLLLPAVYKPIADRWFYDRLITDGMVQYRAYAWFRAVVVFGAGGVKPASQPTIQRAPIPYPVEPVTKFSPIPGYLAGPAR